MPAPAQTQPRSDPAGPPPLVSHLLDLREIAVSPDVLKRCADLDGRIVAAADGLKRLGPAVDLDVLRLVQGEALDIGVPSDTPPVRFPSRPSLDDALAARVKISSCAILTAAIAGRAPTPWHLRQTNAAALGTRPLPFRTGPHHLAPDADGIAIVFPPTDCARALTALCAWLMREAALPVTAQALIAYLQICKLHAFHDGNGRTARLLLTAVLNARLIGAAELYLPLAAVIFANAEFVSAHYRRATDARALDGFLGYGAALLTRVLDAADALAANRITG